MAAAASSRIPAGWWNSQAMRWFRRHMYQSPVLVLCGMLTGVGIVCPMFATNNLRKANMTIDRMVEFDKEHFNDLKQWRFNNQADPAWRKWKASANMVADMHSLLELERARRDNYLLLSEHIHPDAVPQRPVSFYLPFMPVSRQTSQQFRARLADRNPRSIVTETWGGE